MSSPPCRLSALRCRNDSSSTPEYPLTLNRPTCRYDYGVMCLRSGNWPKGEECFREALALDPRHVPSLTAYAVLLCLMDRYTNAETYLKGAVDFDPDNATAWALCVLFYDMESRDLERRAALKRYIDITSKVRHTYTIYHIPYTSKP